MKKQKCPVCGKYTYSESEGDWDFGIKLTPDVGRCSNCGFYYFEDYYKSFDEQVEMMKKALRQKVKNKKVG